MPRFPNSSKIRWTSRASPPPYYSNAVTIAPSGMGAQMATLRDLGTALGRPWSVKDSFSVLDLAPIGLQPLFDAEWIWRDPSATRPRPGRHKTSWRQATTPTELERWEEAWKQNGSPANSRVFLPELLANEPIALFAARRGDAIVAGCAANRSAKAVGFSNFFAADGDEDILAATAVDEVLQFAPGLPVVGYLRGKMLARVRRLGFHTVGALRVWITDGT
jgi:hypothetical protein